MKKELNIISYFNFRALFMGIGLSSILITSKEYFFISILIGYILSLILLSIYKVNNNNIFNSISNYIIYLICLIIFSNMISTMYLTEMNLFIILLPISLLLIYLLGKKEIIIIRISHYLLFINIALYLLAILSLIKYINLNHYFVNTFNKLKVLEGSIKYCLISTTPYLVSNNNTKLKDIFKSYTISTFTMSILFFLTYIILGTNLIEIFRYPEYIILKKVSLSSAIQNIENIISFMWIIDLFMVMSTCLNKIKKNINNSYILNILIMLSIFIVLIISKYYQIIISIYNYITFILLFLLLINLLHKKNKV